MAGVLHLAGIVHPAGIVTRIHFGAVASSAGLRRRILLCLTTIALAVDIRIELVGTRELALDLGTQVAGMLLVFAGVFIELLGLGGLRVGFGPGLIGTGTRLLGDCLAVAYRRRMVGGVLSDVLCLGPLVGPALSEQQCQQRE